MTILIAANITKPIKKLVEFCALIGKGEYGNKIVLKRGDEIGQLGLAFNQMLEQLDTSMNELISVKNYNQDILNNIEKGIVTFDFNGKILSKNPFADQLIEEFDGYTYEEQDLLSIVEKIVFLTNSGGKSKNKLFEFVKIVDGDKKVLDFYMSSMWEKSGNIRGYICSFNDITERRKLESRIQRLDRLATAGRLASGVAHEIRNPLTGMRTSIQVLKKRLKNLLSGSNEIMFDRLIKEIDRMNKLISDLLDYSTRSDYKPEKVNIYQSVSDTLALLDDELESKGIFVSLEIDLKGLNFFIDQSHFNQILLNLIKNAMDAVNPYEGVIRIEGRYADESLAKTELIISDNGSGISQDLAEKIFDPFFTTKADGTGLGMFVVHELVQQNSGEIDVHGVEGEGTRIVLRFKTGGEQNE
jgi:nitrogen fixation/metabolism regulation signal transduction histidine kinase